MGRTDGIRRIFGIGTALLAAVLLAACASGDRAPRQAAAQPEAKGESPLMVGADGLLGAVFFNHGSTTLTANGATLLKKVAEHQKATEAYIRVYGHASYRVATKSERTRRVANFRISASRTQAVVRQLRRLGVPQDHIGFAADSDNWPGRMQHTNPGEGGDRHVLVRQVATLRRVSASGGTAVGVGKLRRPYYERDR